MTDVKCTGESKRSVAGLKFYEESEFDIFEAQGSSRDPLKRSRDQN